MPNSNRPISGKEKDPSSATRELLVVTAIRLFAERGLHGVSLRAVGEAAGQRNTAAVHYHFGDRESLLDAAIEHVLEAVRLPLSHAQARALGLKVSDPQNQVQAVIGNYFLPVLTLPIRHPDWGKDGARLLSRIMLGEAASLAKKLEAKTISDADELLALLSPLLPGLPHSLLKLRLDFATISVICGLCGVTYLEAVEDLVDYQALFSDLTDHFLSFVCAGVSAPVGVA